ncbi:hypothetical protein Tco_1408739 [Tanacetum coccineum]
MPWYSRCSWCGGPFNGGNCRRCTNMSFGEEFVRNPDPISNDETPEFSYPPSQPQTSSLDQRSCFHCGGPLVGDVRCQRCTCKTCGCYLSEGFCRFCKTENSSINPPNDFTHPPQPQYESNSCEKCGNDSHYGYDCSPRFPLEEQEAQSFTPYLKFPIFDDDDDEYTIQYREYLENLSNAITPDLSTEKPDNSLSMGDEHLDTIPEMESDKIIKSNVEDLVLIPSESEGIFDNMCDVPSCDKKHFDAESDLMEYLLNCDTLIIYSPKIDSLLEKFSGELAPINPIPPGIHEADFDPKEDIRLDDQMFYDDTLSDDDSFDDINYVEASPPDSELVSIEEVEDDIIRAKLLNIYLLIAKIESLNDNPTPSSLSHSDNSLPEFKTFSNHTEETRSGSTTTHAKKFLPGYDSFHFEIESDQGELSKVVMEIIDEIDVFLDIDVSTDLEDGYHDSEGDIIYLESLLINNTIPNLSPEDCLDFESSRAWCFVHRSLALQILSMLILGIRYS